MGILNRLTLFIRSLGYVSISKHARQAASSLPVPTHSVDLAAPAQIPAALNFLGDTDPDRDGEFCKPFRRFRFVPGAGVFWPHQLQQHDDPWDCHGHLRDVLAHHHLHHSQ